MKTVHRTGSDYLPASVAPDWTDQTGDREGGNYLAHFLGQKTIEPNY